MEEVISGIYQLKVPIPDNPLGYLLAYLIQQEDGYLLVDCGWNAPEAFDALADQLGRIGADFPDIKEIVITHFHPDHYGLAGRIRELSGARLYLHEREANLIRSRYQAPESFAAQMQAWLRQHGVPEAELSRLGDGAMARTFTRAALPDTVLRGGEEIIANGRKFRVIFTPGHSPGHVCLYSEAEGLFIAGDHVLPTITPNVSLHPDGAENPLGEYLESLRSVAGLRVRLVLPAHEYAFGDLARRVREILDHHEERNHQIIGAVKGQPRTAYEVAARVPWNIGPWETLSAWTRRMALMETLAHLRYLESTGRVRSAAENGLIYWQAAP
jgi:glyoxylase-like metal-dependent hydrolase (beta-lactamase superfamily II)